MKYKDCKTREEKREFILKYDLSESEKKIVIFDKIAETTLDIIYAKYSGEKLKEKKRYKPTYIEHKKY
jgi:hypothetical protein